MDDVLKAVVLAVLAAVLMQLVDRVSYDEHGLRIAAVRTSDTGRA